MEAVGGEKPDVIMVDDRSVERDRADGEKAIRVRMIDNIRVLGLSDDDAEFYNSVTEEKRKQITHKVDIRLLPMLAILYLISHLDRKSFVELASKRFLTDSRCEHWKCKDRGPGR